jgi:hypothetical protein
MSGEVLAIQESATEAGATPVPESEIVAGEFAALLVTVTVPVAVPGVAGSKATVSVVDWFGASMIPVLTPLELKPAPLAFTPEIVSFVFPVFVRVMASELVVPSFTFPKLKLVGFAASSAFAAIPVPLKAIVSGELGALLISVSDPDALPADDGVKTPLNVALFPAAIVKGAFNPEVLKPVPIKAACETVRLALPPFETVMVCELLLPTTTLPNAALDGATAIWLCVPVPFNAIAIGEPGALLAIEMLPPALPAEDGVKLAEKPRLWPALSVRGVDMPAMAKPVPEALADEIVTLALPVFVRVIGCNPLLPTATLPKLTLAELAVSFPWTPIPLSAMVAGGPGALLLTEMLPELLPAAAGANWAANVALAPGATVWGKASPLMLNPWPDNVADEIVNAAVPELISVMFCEELLPTLTLPKFKLVGMMLHCNCVPVPLNAIVMGEPGASLTIEMLPLALPAEDGVKLAEKPMLWPTLSVIGVAKPAMAKPVPEALADEIVILAVAELVRVIGCNPLLPTATLPKLTLIELAVSCPRQWCRSLSAGVPLRPEVGPVDAGANRAGNVAPAAKSIIGNRTSPAMLTIIAMVVRVVESGGKRMTADCLCEVCL